MLLRRVKLHGVDAVYDLNLRQQALGRLVGDAGDHDFRRGEGGELRFHDVQTPPGLSVLGEVARDVVVYIHPVARKNAEDCKDGEEQEEKGLPVHYHRRDLLHERAAAPFFHTQTPCKARFAASSNI